MKKLGSILVILIPLLCKGQVNENFSDGNFTNNPCWTGTTSTFVVNSSFQLQSKAPGTSTSFLVTPSEAIDNAVWEFSVKMTYPTSSSNYAAIYIVSDNVDLSLSNGYYVQVGGTNDEVSLFVQEGAKKTKIIDGADKRTDGNPVEIRIRVTRDAVGNFGLYTMKPTETDFACEGIVENVLVKKNAYFGLMYVNTSTTGSCYYFDDILVTGDKFEDKEPPVWKNLEVLSSQKLRLTFSEPMDFSKAAFTIEKENFNPASQEINPDKTTVNLTFDMSFERGEMYALSISGLTDISGNILPVESRNFGLVEPMQAGDVVINEIMFDNPIQSTEYVELYNCSDKLIDLSGMTLAARKSNGSLNSGIKIPFGTVLSPSSYVAFCENADSVKNYHHCTENDRLISVEWQSLNNEKGILAFANFTKDTVFDEVAYNTKWHHMLVKNPKGVALERIHPSLIGTDSLSWHSASSQTNYGTPGYRNSQYRDTETSKTTVARFAWPDPEAFSPDNDGRDDVCFIRYKTEKNGFVAKVMIFNPGGQLVRRLYNSILLSSEGFLIWDGRTDKGQSANPGVYVIYFEIFNPHTGVCHKSSVPVVVSSI